MSGCVPYKVLSCSAENPDNPSSNIYQTYNQGGSYWETPSDTCKVEMLVGLSSLSSIRTIILENSGAAMIEVLGGKKGQDLDDFQVLLPVHALRTIQEIKNNQNEHETKHIRCKSNESLKVDRLRIILRHFSPCIFGLRSLQISTTRFTKRESTETASAAPTATPVPTLSESKIPKIETKKEKAEEPEKEAKQLKAENKSSAKQTKDEKPPLPFKGITIVISGIGNPERSDIRDKACKLGASYSANWNKTSTHLICAVFNQQKCLQAKKDKKPIVLPKWVHDCYKKRKRLNEDKYILVERSARTGKRKTRTRNASPKRSLAEFSDDSLSDLSGSMSDPSEDPEWDSEAEEEPPRKKSKKNDPTMGGDWGIVETPNVEGKSKSKKSKKEFIPESNSDEDLELELELDVNVDDDVSMGDPSSHVEDSESEATEEMDTETITKAMETKTEPANDNESSEDLNDMVVVKPPGKQGPLETLPDFMSSVRCNIHVSDEKLAQQLKKYITAYKGSVDRFLYTDTTYLVTDKEWQPSFSRAHDQMQSLQIVSPEWILDCHKKQTLVDPYDYLVPDD